MTDRHIIHEKYPVDMRRKEMMQLDIDPEMLAPDFEELLSVRNDSTFCPDNNLLRQSR